MIAPDTLLQNRYRIARLLAKGGMGAVYLAKDLRLNSSVALKETLYNDKKLFSAFEREAHMLANLYHTALPTVLDYFTEGEGQFLVMEFIPGDDLGEVLEKRKKHMEPRDQPKPFPLDEVLDWADQLLDALEYLHKRQPPIIHRDIKPENLKLTARGQIILLDFGLAKGTPMKMSRRISWGSLFGFTLSYAPLEQMQDAGTDARSDLYSLAATLYHLLTGEPPINAMKRAANMMGDKTDPLRPADEMHDQVPIQIAAILTQAMSLDRGQRPNSAAEMREELRRATRATAALREDRTTATEPPAAETPTVIIAPERSIIPPREQAPTQRPGQHRPTSPPIATMPEPPTEIISPPVTYPSSETIPPENERASPTWPEPVFQPRQYVEPTPRQAFPVIYKIALIVVCAVIVIAAAVGAILFLRSSDGPAPVAEADAPKATSSPTSASVDKPAAPAPAPLVESMSYYLELERDRGRPTRSAGADPIDQEQRFRLRFSPEKRGYLYIIAPGEGDAPTTFLTAKPVAAGDDYQFPAGNNWIRVQSLSETIRFTIVFSPTQLTEPDFLASSPGQQLEEADLKGLKALSPGAVIEVEEDRAMVKIPAPAEGRENEPTVFDIIIKRS